MFSLILLKGAIVLALLAIVNATAYDTIINLGSCSNFAVLAGTAVSFNGALTTIAVGSVGVAPGVTITGNYLLSNGAVEDNSSAAIQCAADNLVAYKQAAAAVCTTTLTSSDLTGLTLYPGVYCSASGKMVISAATVTLDAQNDPNAVWVFQTATTLTTATATSFILLNGAKASNVFWQIGSSATIGLSSEFVGTILAYASISFGTTSVMNGRALAQAAVSFAGGSTVTESTSTGIVPSAQPTNLRSNSPVSLTSIPSKSPISVSPTKLPIISPTKIPVISPTKIPIASPTKTPTFIPTKLVTNSPTVSTSKAPSKSPSVTTSSPIIGKYDTTINLGSCSNFAVQAGTAVSFNGVLTTIAMGSVGVAPGVTLTGNYILDNGAVQDDTQAAIQCAADNLVAYKQAAAAVCTTMLTSSDLTGLTLYPGVYCSASGKMIISASTVTLDAQNDPNAVWVFQTATTLVTATATSFILLNGAKASNVFWQIGSSATIGYSSEFVGTILAYASISFGTTSVMNGRALAQAAVSFAGGSTITGFTTATTKVVSNKIKSQDLLSFMTKE